MKLAGEYGPIYWLDMMDKPLVVVSGFELVDELCDETRFDKSVRGPLRRLRSFAGDGLFTAYTQEPNWSKAHNIHLPASTLASAGCRAIIDVTRDMTSLTLDTIVLI